MTLARRLFLLLNVSIGVLLEACGGGGGGSSAASTAPPVASTSADATDGVAPLTVNFDASSSRDPQGRPLTYSWTFTDGGSATGVRVSHTFQTHGNYAVTTVVSNGPRTAQAAPINVSVRAAPPTIQPLTPQINVIGVAPTTATAKIVATDRENLPLTYTLETEPAYGTATVDATTGVLTYTIPGFGAMPTDVFGTTVNSDVLVVTVSNGLASMSSNVSLTINSDPLVQYQWHIQNSGQFAFADVNPVAGNDLNVTGAWLAGFSGKGIKVGVVDSGLDAAHEDLAANTDLAHSHNFVTLTNDPSPDPTLLESDHGTQVAGIIGAVAFNGRGGRGVAYNVRLRGYNLIAPGAWGSAADLAFAFGGDPTSADNDVFNASYGSKSAALSQYSNTYQAVNQNTLSLRGGRGAAMVFAAGNEFQDFAPSSPLCATSRAYGVSCGDPAVDDHNQDATPIVVGALNAAGTHAPYSNTGASLWVSAPGGDYGLNSTYLPGHSDYWPAIITTSLTGCQYATDYGAGVLENDLDSQGASPFARNCQYTALMNGTSSAAPNTTAVIALMLEANPTLTVRDIKDILARTAKRVEPTFSGVAASNIVPGSTVILEQGWVQNSAGFFFSNRYGFGGVDATAAVTAAQSMSTLPPQQTSAVYGQTATGAGAVPSLSTVGLSFAFAVTEPFNAVEELAVLVNIDQTPDLGAYGLQCNQIELLSPSGTKSILLHAANGFVNASLPSTLFGSNAFYGEPVNGTWTLTFYDWCASTINSTLLSITSPQQIIIVGH